MEFTLLDNGTDSLKKAKLSIKQFEGLYREHSYHHLKDAIIFLNHGIEILLKYILSSRNESLIFKDIKVYMKAKEQLKHLPPKEKVAFGISLERNMPTIFDVSERDLGNKKLETVTLREALSRVEFLCDIEVTQEFKNYIFLINDYRNNLTHHSIKLTEADEERLITVLKALYDKVLDFFEQHIKGLMEEVDRERFEVTKEEWEEIQRDMADYYHERAISDLSEDDFN